MKMLSVGRHWRQTLLALWLIVNPFVRGQNTNSPPEIAEYLLEVVGQFQAYPPIDPHPEIWTDGSVVPIDVYVTQNILEINTISPGTSEFTATTRTSYYWTPDRCNQTAAHTYACDTTLSNGNGLKFFTARNAKSLPQRRLFLSEENIHSTKFAEDGYENLHLSVEQTESRTDYSQTFDMRYFPWEVHILDITLQSLYTTNIANVIRFPGDIESQSQVIVPNGWEWLGTYCESAVDDGAGDKDAVLQGLKYTTYNCSVGVSRRNGGWWWTSFLLFSALIFMAYAGSVGLTSHMVAECREDRDSARKALFDGTRMVGTYTIGLLLTYVFQVQISPYGNSIEFWPTFPTSSMIYVLGLIAIIVQSFAGLMGSIIFVTPLVGDGFTGGLLQAYDLDQVPKEGEVGEDRAPLVLKKYNPNKQIKDPEPKEETAALVKSDEEVEEQAVPQESPKENSDPDVVDPSIARTRKNNQKGYVVLSVEEAEYVNDFVKKLFLFKTGLFISIAICAFGILVAGRVGYGNVRQEINDFLASKGLA